VEKPSFLDRTEAELRRLAADTAHLPVALVVGHVGRADVVAGKHVVNAASVIDHGEVAFRQHKMLLPTYDVFDEGRYFLPADRQHIWQFRGQTNALTICEDAWNDKQYWERRLYQRDPVEELVHAGAKVLISINASPYHMGKRLPAPRGLPDHCQALRHSLWFM